MLRGLAALALVVVACRGPSTAPGNSTASALPSGEAARLAYWGERGIRLDCWTSQDGTSQGWTSPGWAPVTEDLPVHLSITNLGTQRLELVLVRRSGWGPFREREEAKGIVDLVRSGPVIGIGSRIEEDRRFLPMPAEVLVVEPGEEAVLDFTIEAQPQRWRSYQELLLRPQLYPLAVRCGEEPERFVALAFPELRVRLAPTEVLESSSLGDWTALEAGLTGPAEHLLAFAMRYSALDRIKVTDRLVEALPGPSVAHRAAMLAALSRITGQLHGDRVERWRSWWSSRDGTRWAMEQRRNADPLFDRTP